MQIISFSTQWADGDSSIRVGALLNETFIFDFTHAYEGELPDTSLRWLDIDGAWFQSSRARFAEASENVSAARDKGWLVERKSAYWFAPIPRPGKLICIGLNYRDHAAESKMAIPEKPVVFSKFSTAVIAPGEPVVIPPFTSQVDYEAELGVVIGRRARTFRQIRRSITCLATHASTMSARATFSLPMVNGSAASRVTRLRRWVPTIVTTDEVPDPHKLSIKLLLNGKPMQDSNTDQLIFGVPRLVEFLSETITLEPGDVIATGTPPGVGFARKPPVFLQEGDEMEVVIERSAR